jgi:hypothetical protein
MPYRIAYPRRQRNPLALDGLRRGDSRDGVVYTVFAASTSAITGLQLQVGTV